MEPAIGSEGLGKVRKKNRVDDFVLALPDGRVYGFSAGFCSDDGQSPPPSAAAAPARVQVPVSSVC